MCFSFEPAKVAKTLKFSQPDPKKPISDRDRYSFQGIGRPPHANPHSNAVRAGLSLLATHPQGHFGLKQAAPSLAGFPSYLITQNR
jgi:hypothetical protein